MQNWEAQNNKLTKTFEFQSFEEAIEEAIEFMVRASKVISQMDHHPEWTADRCSAQYRIVQIFFTLNIPCVEIIGEATKKLSEPFKAQNSDIEWKKIAGTRDKLIHDYYGIDYEIVWNIITQKIEQLHDSLSKL